MFFSKANMQQCLKLLAFLGFFSLSFFLGKGDLLAGGLQRLNVRLGNQLRPQKYALLIGVNQSLRTRYWNPLRYASKDAKRMARMLRTQAGFDRIVLLTSPKETTKASIISAFQRLKSLIKSPEDTLLVYISAHGTLSQGRWRYIVTSDTTQKVETTGLSVRLLQRLMAKPIARKKGLILATCYTGSNQSKAVRAPGTKGASSPRPFPKRLAVQILSAASFAQAAFESEALKSDVYTHFFMKCFQQLSSKTIIKIHVCASGLTTPYVQKWNGQVQVPKAYSQLGANYDFRLAGKGSNSRKLGYFKPTNRKGGLFYRLFRMGSKGNQEAGKVGASKARSIDASSSEWVAAEPGRYRVVAMNSQGQVIEQSVVTIQSGQTVGLLSPWSLELQGGTWASNGYLQQSGDWYGSFFFGARRKYFALLIGGWSGTLNFDGDAYQQLALEVRVEGGYRKTWQRFDLFAGGFVGTGLLLQDINQRLSPSFTFRPGLTISPSYWLSDQWGLLLGLDLSVLPVRAESGVRVAFGFAVRLGLRFRLTQ